MKKLTEKQKKWIERTIDNDRSYKRFLYGRFYTFLFAVFAQLVGFGVLVYLLAYNSPWALALQIVTVILEIVFVIYIISGHERPSSRLNWIILILTVPIFGVPMYLMNGRGRPARRMKKKVLQAQKTTLNAIENECGSIEIPAPKTRDEAIAHYLAKHCRYPLFTTGTVEYYKSGEEMFPHMLEELEKAEKFILFEYFIIAHGKMWNQILKILVKKAMQGVKIRIIYDDFGCMMNLSPKYERYLEGLHENIKCVSFNPVVPFFALRMNHRDHRKILVIDGKVGFTGGINIADEYIAEKERFGYWKDSGIKITGESVRSLTQAFFYLWTAFSADKEPINAYLPPANSEKTPQANQEKTDEKPIHIQPYDDSPLDLTSTGESVYADVINRAKSYVWIFTPYLVLDDYLRGALCTAALRGVDVRIVTPGIPDKKTIFRLTRANYTVLLKAGVKIYEYTPGFIHAKSIISDDECAVVGTINFDYRSLYHHFENAVYFSGTDAVLSLKRDCEETFAISKECTLENTKRGIIGRQIDAVLRVFETLL